MFGKRFRDVERNIKKGNKIAGTVQFACRYILGGRTDRRADGQVDGRKGGRTVRQADRKKLDRADKRKAPTAGKK